MVNRLIQQTISQGLNQSTTFNSRIIAVVFDLKKVLMMLEKVPNQHNGRLNLCCVHGGKVPRHGEPKYAGVNSVGKDKR